MKNNIVKLECIDITVDFYGVCKYEGLVVFVKCLIPGEIANVKIIKVKNKIAYGIIDKLIKKSEHRIKEPCPIAYKCGSCDIQYIAYDYQLSLKHKLVETTFNNMKLATEILPVLPSPKIYSYRNKIQVPVNVDKIGYYRAHSNDIVDFDKCYIADDLAEPIFLDIKRLIKKYDLSSYIRHIVIRNTKKEMMVCLVSNAITIPHINEVIDFLSDKYSMIKSILININNKDTNVIFGNQDYCLYGNDYIIDNVNDISYMIPLRSFYQVNSLQMKNLYDLVISEGNLNINDSVLDLFCGIGTISLYISKYVSKVLGIEIIDKSIEYANKNRELNHIENVEFIKGDANDIEKYLGDFNVIIVDPPRKGLEQKLIVDICNSSVNKLIYISCNQATLARDIKLLSDKFTIEKVKPIDMFPQTKHIESISILTRK